MTAKSVLAALTIGVAMTGAACATNGSITEADVEAAQQAWGEGIVAIGEVYSEGGDFEARAREHIETLYAYEESDVLFKPTLAADDQFRGSFDEALSYFIGTEGTEDGGFAIRPWTEVRFEDAGTVLSGDYAVAMGNYYFTPADGGDVAKVEYTFGYMLDEDGDLLINVHHSSLPYNPGS